jgi:hypothetical protein
MKINENKSPGRIVGLLGLEDFNVTSSYLINYFELFRTGPNRKSLTMLAVECN